MKIPYPIHEKWQINNFVSFQLFLHLQICWNEKILKIEDKKYYESMNDLNCNDYFNWVWKGKYFYLNFDKMTKKHDYINIWFSF